MRDNIYYWKCDQPLSAAAKRQFYFADKYDREGLNETVTAACRRALGDDSASVEPMRVDGNHLAFIVQHAGRSLFFRADDGSGDDDYMLAESALMERARAAGLPVPQVIHTDVSRAHCPYRFQIMERCTDPSLNVHQRQGTLDLPDIARQLGQCLARLHSVTLDGFGFIDTGRLAAEGVLRGLDPTYADYFRKRLADHLAYLRQHELLEPAECDEIERQFRRHAPRLQLDRGVLVHRDMALWNVLGTPTRITAIIDWDDAVSGDPADDVGVLQCFHDQAFMAALLGGYWGRQTPPGDFISRVWLHTLRNMLWKTMLRHALGYFDRNREFFLNTPDVRCSLREHTLNVLREALERVRSDDNP